MSAPHTNIRRPSSSSYRQRRQSDNDIDDTTSLLLSRTKSHEINVAESIAIQDAFADGTKSDVDAEDDSESTTTTTTTQWPYRVRYLVMLCSFLTSLSFGVTQVPLLYVFRLMACDAYYETHQPPGQSVTEISRTGATASVLSYAFTPFLQSADKVASRGTPDRCAIHAIESSTALSITLLGASTMVFGILNLLIAGNLIKRIGVKRTLLIQVFFPAFRLLIQNIGVEVWGSTGIIIVQCSQIISLLGGPSGYVLVLNTFITEVVEYEGRTAALGRLAGAMMFGSASGFLLGGLVADAFGIKAPFRLTLMLFLLSVAYVAIFLPHVPLAKTKSEATLLGANKKEKKGVSRFFGPLAVFGPQKLITREGKTQTSIGAFLLAWGVYLGVLATGYLPTLLQLYSTDVFQFATKQNGWLIFMYSTLRGVFLTFAFPNLIALGRKITSRREQEKARHEPGSETSSEPERQPLLTSTPSRTNGSIPDSGNHKVTTDSQTFTFDLTYTRLSLMADGLLTLLCTFVHEGWQMYLVAAILPFSAGTGSAAKGTILQMIGSSASSDERTDALAGISLIENVARLSTTFVFGILFAAFTSIGRAELIFTVNAAAALIGFIVLLFARFPPEGSRRLTKEEIAESSS